MSAEGDGADDEAASECFPAPDRAGSLPRANRGTLESAIIKRTENAAERFTAGPLRNGREFTWTANLCAAGSAQPSYPQVGQGETQASPRFSVGHVTLSRATIQAFSW
jgi:hypothetical protein